MDALACRVRDRGNASPRYMRMTLNYVSASHDLLRTSQMPLAVIIQPLAIPEAGDDQLQVCYGSAVVKTS